MWMQRLAISFVAIVIWPLAEASRPAEGYVCLAYRDASLLVGEEILKFEKQRLASAEPVRWSNLIKTSLDDVKNGAGTVLVLHREETCKADADRYVPSDCGVEVTVVFSVDDKILLGKQIEWTQIEGRSGVGAALAGTRDAPGITGCFGFPKQGSIRFVENKDGKLIADMDLAFEMKPPHSTPRICKELQLNGRFEFEWKAIPSK